MGLTHSIRVDRLIANTKTYPVVPSHLENHINIQENTVKSMEGFIYAGLIY